MGDMPYRPDRYGNRIPNLRAKPVDDIAHEQKSKRIGRLKCGDDISVIVLIPI